MTTATIERSPQACRPDREHQTATLIEAIGSHIVDSPTNACQDRMSGIKQMIDQLSPQKQETVITLVRQLAEQDGIRVVHDPAMLTTPVEALDRWLSELELNGLSKHTIVGYRCHLGGLLREYPTPTEQDVKEYLVTLLNGSTGNDLEARKNSLSTKITIFKVFFKYLYENGLWNEDPTRNLRRPKLAKREKRIPKLADVQKLLSKDMSLPDRIIIQLLLDTGMRVEELATIKIKNIQLDRQRLIVMGKGQKERVVPLSPSTARLLDAYLQELPEASDYLFPSRKCTSSKNYTTTYTFRRHLEALCEKAGIPRIHPHALRHLVATTLLERGADIKAVSQLLGHADVMITLQVYHHVGRKAVEDMHSRLGVFSSAVARLDRGS